MSNLRKVDFSEFGEIITGKTPSSANPEDFGDETPFVTPSDSFEQKYIDSTQRYLSPEGVKKLKGKLLPANSVLVTCIGSAMGKVAMVRSPSITNQQINSIKINSNFDPEYIYYCLKNNYKLLRNAAGGSTALPLLNKTEFELLSCNVNSEKDEQKKIADVLSAIDKKIELNNRINAELEAMAKTLYDYWFVQFDFPDDSPQGQGKPYKTSGGKMIYNPTLKREIPEGWEVDTLASWIESDKTGDWGKEEQEGNYTLQVDCIRGADINGLNGNGKIVAPNRFILKKNDHKLLAPFDLVIEISGGSPTQSTGRMAYITDDVLGRFTHPLICSNFCKAISLRNKDLFYCFAYLWNDLYGNGVLFGWEGKTSGIKNLLFDSFVTKHQVPIPPLDLAKQFFDFVAPLEQKKQTLLKESARLESLRDWLLPMLMNGQVTVK